MTAGCSRPSSSTGSSGDAPSVPDREKSGDVSRVGDLEMKAIRTLQHDGETLVVVLFVNRSKGKRFRVDGVDGASLRDEHGNNYAYLGTFRGRYQPGFYPQTIDPGEENQETFMFERPTAQAVSFTLEVPASNFRLDGTFRYHFKRPPDAAK